ncbi:MAG: 2-amino-4-hydroxy-6-hydroxymethyldihydropteridine diphosphokinase [Candidatus Aminicenantes bacterium]|nr:2-amino-4-hydroxy-6-hydroxymethyldihydropteridine diphosphokinase [Candidatus Aminicenantes bacterium]
MRYHLSLGSNLGRKARNLERARRLLEENGVRILRRSSLYKTEPVGLTGQPPFVNQALSVDSRMSPEALLALLKKLEKAMKRVSGKRFGPRVIDIDILLAGRRVVASPRLRVPHPRLAERRFVLTALAEIVPKAVHPVLKKTIGNLLRETTDPSGVTKMRR